MDATRDLKRSGSKMPHVPSFNDFCSGVGDEVDMPQLSVPKPAPPMVQRSWSVDSQEGTPRALRTQSSFSETFTRALYEHMRGN